MIKDKKFFILAIIFTILTAGINVFIIVHSCLDANASTQSSNNVAEVVEEIVNTVAPNTITEANHDDFLTFVRKAFGHFGLFMISGLISPFASYYWFKYFDKNNDLINLLPAIGLGIIIAIATEIIQRFVPGRSGELTDVLIDLGGFVLGFSIIFVVFLIIFMKNRKNKLVKINEEQMEKIS